PAARRRRSWPPPAPRPAPPAKRCRYSWQPWPAARRRRLRPSLAAACPPPRHPRPPRPGFRSLPAGARQSGSRQERRRMDVGRGIGWKTWETGKDGVVGRYITSMADESAEGHAWRTRRPRRGPCLRPAPLTGIHSVAILRRCPRRGIVAGTHSIQSQEAEPDMMRPLPIAAALALAAVAPAAFAQQTTAGNAEAGRELTYTCVGCHGIEGYKNAYPHYHVPKIGGQSSEYLV